jgi:hypothetical protein
MPTSTLSNVRMLTGWVRGFAYSGIKAADTRSNFERFITRPFRSGVTVRSHQTDNSLTLGSVPHNVKQPLIVEVHRYHWIGSHVFPLFLYVSE